MLPLRAIQFHLGRGLRLPRWLIVLVALLCIDFAATLAWVELADVMLPRNANGEAIAILWGDDNSFGAETERRVGHAMDLWRAGSPKRLIFCVGGTRRSQGFSGADEMCRRLAAGGIPLDRKSVV